MNIYAKKGDKVIYLSENGYDSDKEYADTILKKGETYTVGKTVVHSWMTDVYLEEFPDHIFNSVMFDDLNNKG